MAAQPPAAPAPAAAEPATAPAARRARVELKGGKRALHRRSYFATELKAMLYGFGDVHDPYEETVETVEDAVHDYVANTLRLAQQAAGKRGGPTKFNHIVHVVRRDIKKKQRIKELLLTSEEIQEAKKAYKENEK